MVWKIEWMQSTSNPLSLGIRPPQEFGISKPKKFLVLIGITNYLRLSYSLSLCRSRYSTKTKLLWYHIDHSFIQLIHTPLHIPHKYPISPGHVVCDREIWVFMEFTKNFPKTLNTIKGNMYAIWVDCQLHTNFRGRLQSKSPSFLQHYPRVCKMWHTIDRYITSFSPLLVSCQSPVA